MKVKINNDIYNVDVAIKEADLTKGLSGTKELGDDKGMLFLFKNPRKTFMVMDKMNYSLDIVFISKDGKITNVESAKPGDDEYYSDGEVKAVLEIKSGRSEGYEVGTNVSIIKDKETTVTDKEKARLREVGESFISGLKGGGSILTKDPSAAVKIGDVRYKIGKDGIDILEGALHVLDNDGNVMYNMKGGNRVFSIPHTKEVFTGVLEASEGGEVKSIELGKKIVEIFNIHDNQEEQFVKK